MTGAVGIFWMVNDVLVAAGCELEDAARYGDCLTYDGGHAEHWERWQEAGGYWLAKNGLPGRILTTEYDQHPRGRIVKEPGGFVLYADQRLQSTACITAICELFGLGRPRSRCAATLITGERKPYKVVAPTFRLALFV